MNTTFYQANQNSTKEPYVWIDWPEEGYMAAEWGWEHTLGCAFATFFYLIPGLIFLIIKSSARSKYLAQHEEAKKNHEIAFERTGCVYLFSAYHFGGHPKLPYGDRVLIGLKESGVVEFYTYSLKHLHTAPVEVVAAAIRTIQHVSGGPYYVNTTNEYRLRWAENLNGKVIETEFDMRPYTPAQFVQRFNELQIA